MNKKTGALVVILTIIGIALSGCLGANTQGSQKSTVVQTIQDDGNLTAMAAALNKANLTETLNGTGPFTVFAPNDAAFAALNSTVMAAMNSSMMAGINSTVMEAIQANFTKNLTSMLQYHVVSGKLTSAGLTNNMTLKTLQGEDLIVTVNDTGTYVNNAKIVTKDIDASNGVVQVIDTVLIPPQSIVQTINASSNLTMLAQAIKATNLTAELNGTGPFTMFAPDNEAFSAISNASALMNSTAFLKGILQNMTVPGRVLLSGLNGTTNLTTLGGAQLNITKNSTGTFVNGNQVVKSDIMATNGEIDIISKLQIPTS